MAISGYGILFMYGPSMFQALPIPEVVSFLPSIFFTLIL